MTLDDIKKYLNVDESYTDDDNLITNIYNNVDDAIRSYINVDTSTDLEGRVEQAELMMIAELYDNRDLQTATNLRQSPVFDLLLSTAVNYSNEKF